MHVRILFANPSHNANSVTEFDFPWSANANANFVLLILRNNRADRVALYTASSYLSIAVSDKIHSNPAEYVFAFSFNIKALCLVRQSFGIL